MILDKCPHCNTQHIEVQELHQQPYKTKGKQSNVDQWIFVRCQNRQCTRLILVMISDQREIVGTYPYGSFELDEAAVLDSEIRADYREAAVCLAAGCFKASMVMSRRLLQRCLKAQGYNERVLAQSIDRAIIDNVLRKPLQELAKEIKEYGNFGAHPDDDQLDNIGQAEAETILEFSRLLIEEFYEIPAKAERLRQKRQRPTSEHG